MAQKVAELARQLNRRHGKKKPLPCLILMTDAKRLPDPSTIIPQLPANSAVIVRHFTQKQKEQIIIKIKSLCRKHKVKLLVSDDMGLAIRYRLDGVHFPEARLKSITACGRISRPLPQFLYTGACHSQTGLENAKRAGIDAILLSPVFPTSTHPGARCLGLTRFRHIGSRSPLPIYALGGITKKTAPRLQASSTIGIAGISGLI